MAFESLFSLVEATMVHPCLGCDSETKASRNKAAKGEKGTYEVFGRCHDRSGKAAPQSLRQPIDGEAASWPNS